VGAAAYGAGRMQRGPPQGERAAGAMPAPLLQLGVGVMVEGSRILIVAEQRWRALGPPEVERRRANRRLCGALVLDGERYLVFDAGEDAAPARAGLEAMLTCRERQVAVAIAEGATNKDIARDLGISPFTVREHVRRIGQKLRAPSRARIAAVVGEQRAL
jgi:DNA-binding CsgD family transcriptional regulator